MKILYLHPNSWTGEYPILKKITELGHEICVLEEKHNLGWIKKITPDFSEPGDKIRTLWYDPKRAPEKLFTWPIDRYFKRSFDGRNLAHRMLVINWAVRFFSPDAIVCSDGFSYAIPAAFLKKLGVVKAKLLVTYIGGDILDLPDGDYGKRRTPMTDSLIKKSLRHIDVMRPVSPMLKEVLIDDGAAEQKISVLPSHLVTSLSVLNPIFNQREQIKKQIREQYQIPPDAPLIVTLSGNQKSKGLHILAEAWPQILHEIPGCHWLLCGPIHPWLESNVFPVLERTQTKTLVHATGALSGNAVFEHLAAADLHVNPTLGEGLNMVTVEAAAVGTPTITSDGAGIAGWLERLNCGAVVTTGDAAILAETLINALKNRPQRLSWEQNCRRMAHEFDLERIANGLISLLK